MNKLLLLFITCFCVISKLNAQKIYNEVTLPELLKLKQKDPNLLVLDVRTKAEYYDSSSIYQGSNIGHIKGTINIPLQDFEKDPSIVHQLDAYKDKDIYVICSHSYRSRVVSNLLLDSGFTHVNNTRGGMTEFFRRYNETIFLKNDLYETNVNYKNIAPSQLLEKLSANKNPLLISVSNTPTYDWDSANVVFYKYYPSFKNAMNIAYKDSLKILELVKKDKNRTVVLYNNTNYGAAELANWLTRKGILNVSYLVGSTNLFYEYIVDKKLTSSANKFLKFNTGIQFIAPSNYCNETTMLNNSKIIDIRDDTVFNKITEGAKYNYKHLKTAINFPFSKGESEFEKKFTDKKKGYVFISQDGIDGLKFADDLEKKGYKINWIIGGLRRWEWYMNNVETFKCMDYLVN